MTKAKESKNKTAFPDPLQNVDNLHLRIHGTEAILGGQVRELAMKDAAGQVAKDMGFTRVVNEIEIVPAPPPSKKPEKKRN